MPRWSHCRVEIRHHDETPVHEDADAEVGIQDGQIVIAYMDDDGPVVLGGREREPGRFELLARSRPRRATLSRSADGRVLTGSWQERASSGDWRIELGEPCEADESARDG